MLFVILMLIIFAPELLKIIASKEYGEAVYVIPPVAMSTFFTFMYNIFANVEFFYEEKKFVSIGSILVYHICFLVILQSRKILVTQIYSMLKAYLYFLL